MKISTIALEIIALVIGVLSDDKSGYHHLFRGRKQNAITSSISNSKHTKLDTFTRTLKSIKASRRDEEVAEGVGPYLEGACIYEHATNGNSFCKTTGDVIATVTDIRTIYYSIENATEDVLSRTSSVADSGIIDILQMHASTMAAVSNTFISIDECDIPEDVLNSRANAAKKACQDLTPIPWEEPSLMDHADGNCDEWLAPLAEENYNQNQVCTDFQHCVKVSMQFAYHLLFILYAMSHLHNQTSTGIPWRSGLRLAVNGSRHQGYDAVV